jgi:hypothetical protein
VHHLILDDWDYADLIGRSLVSRTSSSSVGQVRSPEVPDGRVLQAGEYWLSVCHKDGNATGAYSVGVTTWG